MDGGVEKYSHNLSIIHRVFLPRIKNGEKDTEKENEKKNQSF